MAMRLPMRWIAILHGRIAANLAATSGIHRATDALKMLMAGADVTMLCSVLLRRGIGHIAVIEREMREWMEQHEYDSVEQLKGSVSQKNCPDPERLRARTIHAGRFTSQEIFAQGEEAILRPKAQRRRALQSPAARAAPSFQKSLLLPD